MELKTYFSEDIQRYIEYRKKKKKYGERVQYATEVSEDLSAQLQQSDAEYVLLGIPENMSIQPNPGKKSAVPAWEAALNALLNTQHNFLNKGNKLYLSGHLDFEEEVAIFNTLDLNNKEDLKKARKLIEDIDKEVAHIISKIVASGKKPIVIGGGHHNAYGIIKGCALALNKAVNVVNFGAHSDFRREERRRIGNGFSHAFSEGFLQKYYIFGLHENYASKALFKKIKKYERDIQYTTFEEIVIQQKRSFPYYLNHALSHVHKNAFGVELDCNAIANLPGTVMIPSGFSANEARRFITAMGNHKNAMYLHICGAAPNPDNETEMQQTGKLIACLITDFMKKRI